MPNPELTPEQTGSFYCRDNQAFMVKLGAFLLQPHHLAADVDGTLTSDRPTSWVAMSHALPPEGKQANAQLYTYYRELEKTGEMTAQQAEAWTRRVIRLHAMHGVTLAAIEHEAHAMQPRPGARPLMRHYRSKGLPTVWMSAGPRDAIDVFASHHGFYPTEIIATPLVTNDQGQIVEHNDPIITTHNKREQSSTRGIMQAIRAAYPNALLIGDSLTDPQMADDAHGINIRVRVGTPQDLKGEALEAYLNTSYDAGYDIVAPDDTLNAVLILARFTTAQTLAP